MYFGLEESVKLVERTPAVLTTLQQGLSPEWASRNEGEQTWSTYDVVGHLIHAEKADWIPRVEAVLADKADKTLPSFDRFAYYRSRPEEVIAEAFRGVPDFARG
jgi:hypothetical protein